MEKRVMEETTGQTTEATAPRTGDTPMKTWAYVICEWVDGSPSFRHAFVRAEDEYSAYAAGHRDVEQPPRGTGINDYAFEVADQGETPPERS